MFSCGREINPEQDSKCQSLQKKKSQGQNKRSALLLIKMSGLKGFPTTAWSSTPHVQSRRGGSGGQLGCIRQSWGRHLRLFKQISEEYQSPKTLWEILLACSPAAEAFVSWETVFFIFCKNYRSFKISNKSVSFSMKTFCSHSRCTFMLNFRAVCHQVFGRPLTCVRVEG